MSLKKSFSSHKIVNNFDPSEIHKPTEIVNLSNISPLLLFTKILPVNQKKRKCLSSSIIYNYRSHHKTNSEIIILTVALFLGVFIFHSNLCSAQDVFTYNTNVPKNVTKLDSFTSLFACSEINTDLGNDNEQENNPVYNVAALWTKSSGPLNFHLKGGFRNCSSQESFPFSMNISENIHSTEQDPVNEQPDTYKPTAYFESSGLLRIENEYFSPLEYCVKEVDGKNIIKLNVCKPSCKGNQPCLAKCCSIGKSMKCADGDCSCTVDERQNLKSGPFWKPKMYKNPSKEVELTEYSSINPHIIQNSPHCTFPNGSWYSEHETLTSVDFNDFISGFTKVPMRLIQNGRIMYLRMTRTWETLEWDSFCLDDIMTDEKLEPYQERPQLLVKCYEEKEEFGRLSFLFIFAMFLSSFFLFLTAVVYGLLWDKHNIHGWTVLFEVSSTGLLYVFLGISHSLGLSRSNINVPAIFCMVIGVITHFFFISTFCWLTCINFDLMTTFKSHKPVGERSKGEKRFLCYNIFAWGIPLIVVTTGITLDHIFLDIESEVIIPQYGFVNCFMAPWAMGVYVYCIIGVLMAINLIFIGFTLWTIYWFKKSTNMVQNSHSGRPHQSFKLFAKLFVIMGVTWLFEIVSWLHVGEKSQLHWVLLDCLNMLQAISIFIIFVCKAKTIKQLQQKFSTVSSSTDSALCCFKLTSASNNATEIETRTTGTSKHSSIISHKILTTKT